MLKPTSSLDPAASYDLMLEKGIRLSGEDKHFFIRGRLDALRRELLPDFMPRRILDFGCGAGDTSGMLADVFPGAYVVGVDTAAGVLVHAEEHYGGPRVSFYRAERLSEAGRFDLCYANGVFHHIPPGERPGVLKTIFRAIAAGGYFALFENNPLNLGTRAVMRRIPFDRDARPLTHRAAGGLLGEAGFRRRRPKFLFFFPRSLAFLRFLEPRLLNLPYGAQYFILAEKPGSLSDGLRSDGRS